MSMKITSEVLRAVAEYSTNPLVKNWANIEAGKLEHSAGDIELGKVMWDLVGESSYTNPDLARIGSAIRERVASESTYMPDLNAEDEWKSWRDVPEGVKFYSPSDDDGDYWVKRGETLMYSVRPNGPEAISGMNGRPEDIQQYAPFRAR